MAVRQRVFGSAHPLTQRCFPDERNSPKHIRTPSDSENLEGKDHCGELDVNGKIILKHSIHEIRLAL
jgi:hypothetical protein